LIDAPVIPPSPALSAALSRKILPATSERETDLRELSNRKRTDLRGSIDAERVTELREALRKRARVLPAHSQAGWTQWRFEQLRMIARYATEQQWEAFASFAVSLVLGDFADDPVVQAYWHTAHLSPRYKPETMSPDDPRPVGAPDALWRWTVGTIVRMTREAAVRRLGPTDFTIGTPAGYEVMCLALRAEAADRPDLWFLQGDLRNAFNELDREAGIEASIATDPLLGLVAVTCYGGPTRYMQPGGESRSTVDGAVQGCPAGMVFFALGTLKPRQWSNVAMEHAARGESQITPQTPGMAGASPSVCSSLTQMLQRYQEAQGGGEESSEPELRPAPLFHRQKSYADNGAWSLSASLVPLAPRVAACCMAAVGMTYKPQAWEAWSQSGRTPHQPERAGGRLSEGDARREEEEGGDGRKEEEPDGEDTIANITVTLHRPEDGMVVLGGGLSPLPPVGVLGPDSAVRRRMTRVVDGVKGLVRALEQVPRVAATAHAAQRHVLQCLASTVRQRAAHVARMYDPNIARTTLRAIDGLLKDAMVANFGWSFAEAAEAWPQLALNEEHGGLGMRPLERLAPLHHLAAWLSATSTGRMPVPARAAQAPAEYWARAPGPTGARLQALYAATRDLNPALPERFADVEAWSEGRVDTKRPSGGGTEPRTRWSAVLAHGMGESVRARWRRGAGREACTRQSVLGHARWMLQEPPRGRSYPRSVWLVAVRLWCGLPIQPALPDGARISTLCQSKYAVDGQVMGRGHGVRGTLCKTKTNGVEQRSVLDPHGRHAIVCKTGGVAVGRHNLVRDFVGYALRSLVSGVAWEKFVVDIQRIDHANAKLDLVVTDAAHAAVLDMVVFHPIQPNGRSTYGHKAHENRKYATYNQTEEGRRRSTRPLIPVVVSTFGVINGTALDYFARVEESAAAKGMPFVPERAGPKSLCQLASLVTILEVASIVVSAHTQGAGANEADSLVGAEAAGGPGGDA